MTRALFVPTSPTSGTSGPAHQRYQRAAAAPVARAGRPFVLGDAPHVRAGDPHVHGAAVVLGSLGAGSVARPPVVRLVRETAPAYVASAEAPLARFEPEDGDALTALGEEIMTLSEELHAVTHRLLMLVAEFDRRQGWRLYGFGSCAEWLAYSARLDKITAREKVRIARALAGLPETSAAMARGEVSFSQVRALTRVANEENELELLAHARSTSAAGLERLGRSWKQLRRRDEAAQEVRRHASRCLSIFPDEDGSYLVRGRLDPEVGVLLMRAIEAASDALYRGSVPETTPEQRRADALALLTERAMAAGFGEADQSTDAAGASAETPCAAQPMTQPARSERHMVVLHVDAATLTDGEEPGRSELEDGTRVSAETSRRLACDATLVRAVHCRRGEIEVRGKTRAVPARLRRALEVRDRGCRFPGCGSRFTDAHHIKHWADGGATHVGNLILLCKTHHRLLHEGGFRLQPNPDRPDRPTFISPRGIPIPEVPPRMKISGSEVGWDAWEGAAHPPRWEKDVPLALYLRALESLS
jgi:hypothetical protein